MATVRKALRNHPDALARYDLALAAPRKGKRRRSGATPAATLQLSGAALDKLRNHLDRITPSAPWCDELYIGVRNGRVPYHPRRSGLAHALKAARVFPPGGSASLMRPCSLCQRTYPPQYLLLPRFCPACAALLPMLEPPATPGPSGRCCDCHARAELVVVRICADCDAARMTAAQIMATPSSPVFTHRMKDKEFLAHVAAGFRRGRRRHQGRMDDPRILGGYVDATGIIRGWNERTTDDGAAAIEADGVDTPEPAAVA
jgi:hypothetical protein